MDAHAFEELLRPLVEGRVVILAGGPVTSHTPTAALVRRLGARAVLVIGTAGRGAGGLPPARVARYVAVGPPPSHSVSAALRHARKVLADPPPVVLDALAAVDPDRTALVIGFFLNEAAELDGRPFLAWRRPEWIALEDKLTADALWDRSGVARAPSAVVRLEAAALRRAARSLDAGHGTVWAADTTEGFHGGAEMTRWARTPADHEAAMAAFAGHARRVRVMPFLPGVPCSIHGIVFPGHVAVGRPVEQVTFRRPQGTAFFYAGCASFYDPPPGVRRAQEEAARRVGAVLRYEVGYRGPFSIDGIVSGDRFLPTELNPRMSAGLHTLGRSVPELPLQLLLDALVGEVDLPYKPTALERLLVNAADSRRAGGTWSPVETEVAAADEVPLAYDASGWRRAGPGDGAAGWLTGGPNPVGGFLRLIVEPARTPTGPSFASRAAQFWAFADRELGTSMGELLPASAAPSAT